MRANPKLQMTPEQRLREKKHVSGRLFPILAINSTRTMKTNAIRIQYMEVPALLYVETREQAIDLARNLQPDGLTLYRVRFPAWLNLYLNFRRCPLCTGGCVIRPRGQRHHLRPDRIWFSVFVFLPQKTTTPNAGCKVQRKNYYHTISHTEFKQFGRTMTIKAPTKKSYNVDVNCLTMWPCKRATPRTDAVQ